MTDTGTTSKMNAYEASAAANSGLYLAAPIYLGTRFDSTSREPDLLIAKWSVPAVREIEERDGLYVLTHHVANTEMLSQGSTLTTEHTFAQNNYALQSFSALALGGWVESRKVGLGYILNPAFSDIVFSPMGINDRKYATSKDLKAIANTDLSFLTSNWKLRDNAPYPIISVQMDRVGVQYVITTHCVHKARFNDKVNELYGIHWADETMQYTIAVEEITEKTMEEEADISVNDRLKRKCPYSALVMRRTGREINYVGNKIFPERGMGLEEAAEKLGLKKTQ